MPKNDYASETTFEIDERALRDAFNKIREGLKEANTEAVAIYGKAMTREEVKIAEKKEKLLEEQVERQKELEEELIDLRAKRILKTEQEVQKYVQAELDKNNAKNTKERLNTELEILKAQSKAEQERWAFENKIAALNVEIQKAENDGDTEKADNLKKELRSQNREKNIKDNVSKRQEDFNQNGGVIDKLVDQMREDAEFAKTSEGKAAAKQEQQLRTMQAMGKALKDGLNAINNAINAYAKDQTAINARLQGVSTYSEISKTLSDVAYSPLLKTEDLYANVADLVSQGIVTNIEQRAFFATVKDGIATTFDVTSDSLKRIIRLQQADSTAARLGMEGYLTRWLNEYVENTEYLTNTFDNVAASLTEASSVLAYNNNGGTAGAGVGVEFEFVVQKWLGALTGVGLSDSAAQSIAETLGKLGAGNMEALNDDIGKLIVFSTNAAGKNIGEILQDGLDASATNSILEEMVKYLQQLAATNNNVTRAELAKTFGVSVGDLLAATNLSLEAVEEISNDMLSYSGMYNELGNQFNDLRSRMGISNILDNLMSNLTYQTGMNIAANPVTYGIWKITDLIRGATGGINIPAISAMGTGIDLETTVENLVQLGVAGFSLLGNIGKIAGGLGSIGNGKSLLDKLSVTEGASAITTFGGEGLRGRAQSTQLSSMTYVDNTSGEDYASSATNSAYDEQQKTLDQKVEEQAEKDPNYKYLAKEVYLKERLNSMSTALGSMAESETAEAQVGALESQLTEIQSLNESVNLINANMESIVSILEDSTGINLNTGEIKDTMTSSYTHAIQEAVNNEANYIQEAANNEYNNFMQQTGVGTLLNQNEIGGINTTSSEADYLSNISFDQGFKSLVENVAKILNKLDSSEQLESGNNISGLSTELNGYNIGSKFSF